MHLFSGVSLLPAGLDQKMSEDTTSSVRVSVEALKILIEEDRKAGR